MVGKNGRRKNGTEGKIGGMAMEWLLHRRGEDSRRGNIEFMRIGRKIIRGRRGGRQIGRGGWQLIELSSSLLFSYL